MFDKLVESSSTGADLGPRRRIFVASFFFVAVLFATAVVVSIYAADFDLGANNFDIAELLTPVTETEPPREAEPEQTHQNSQTAVSDRTTRVMNIQRMLLKRSADSKANIEWISPERITAFGRASCVMCSTSARTAPISIATNVICTMATAWCS